MTKKRRNNGRCARPPNLAGRELVAVARAPRPAWALPLQQACPPTLALCRRPCRNKHGRGHVSAACCRWCQGTCRGGERGARCLHTIAARRLLPQPTHGLPPARPDPSAGEARALRDVCRHGAQGQSNQALPGGLAGGRCAEGSTAADQRVGERWWRVGAPSPSSRPLVLHFAPARARLLPPPRLPRPARRAALMRIPDPAPASSVLPLPLPSGGRCATLWMPRRCATSPTPRRWRATRCPSCTARCTTGAYRTAQGYRPGVLPRGAALTLLSGAQEGRKPGCARRGATSGCCSRARSLAGLGPCLQAPGGACASGAPESHPSCKRVPARCRPASPPLRCTPLPPGAAACRPPSTPASCACARARTARTASRPPAPSSGGDSVGLGPQPRPDSESALPAAGAPCAASRQLRI